MQAEFARALLDAKLPSPVGLITRLGADDQRRFDIYRNNVMVALTDGLADTYPVVQALVGEPFFRAMAREFCAQCPPRSPVMATYGADFAQFITRFAPAASLPYLPDMARLEWRRCLAWHAPDEQPLAAQEVSHLVTQPERLLQTRWRLHASVSLVESPYAVVSLWAAHQLESDAEVHQALTALDWQQPESALLLRQGLDAMVLKLNLAEAVFVTALIAGNTLAESAQQASMQSPEFDLILTFVLLLRSGALLAFTAESVN